MKVEIRSNLFYHFSIYQLHVCANIAQQIEVYPTKQNDFIKVRV